MFFLVFEARVDNQIFVYNNIGEIIFQDGDYSNLDTLTLPGSNVLLAFKCVNSGGGYSLVGALRNGGAVTDKTWRCVGGAEQSGWYEEDFNDSGWPHAREISDHSFSDIDASAKVIWTQSDDSSIYCRKLLRTGKKTVK